MICFQPSPSAQVWAALRSGQQERPQTSAWTGAAVTEAWRRSTPPQEGGRTPGTRHGSADAPCSPAGRGCSSRWVRTWKVRGAWKQMSGIKFSSCKDNFAHVWKCASDFVKPYCWKYSCTDFNYTKYFCTLKTWICAIFLNENLFPNLHIKTPACNWFHMNTNNAISWDMSSTPFWRPFHASSRI